MTTRYEVEITRFCKLPILLCVSVSLSLLFIPVCGSGQQRSRPAANAVSAEIVSVKANPEDTSDSQVSIRVSMLALTKSVIVPNCAESATSDKVFCVAQLQRFNGKRWRNAKPAVWASLGAEDYDAWSPVTVMPGTEVSYLFGFSTQFYGIRAGEHLRIAISVWPEGASLKDRKSTATVVTPVFECPPSIR
jgi:hypothetical protein